MQFTSPPKDEQELLLRTQEIAGKTLLALAQLYQIHLPTSLHQAKGFVGQMIESILGATSGNQSEPDFPHLGIELKTLPIDVHGKPKESTYICTAPRLQELNESWQTSRLRQKIKRILWVPIIITNGNGNTNTNGNDNDNANTNINGNIVDSFQKSTISSFQIGNAMLWSPDDATEQVLAQDWKELTEMLLLGNVNILTAHYGTYLQIRPKAANSRILYETSDKEGQEISAVPRGFYLRTTLTKKILSEHYL